MIPKKFLKKRLKHLHNLIKFVFFSLFHFLYFSFIQNKDSSSPTAFTQPTTTAAAAASGNGFGGTDFFSQQPSSSNGQHTTSQLLTDDLFSLATPPSQISTNTFFNTNQNTFPAFQQQPFQNALDTTVPKSKLNNLIFLFFYF
jgi:hypothetical protein